MVTFEQAEAVCAEIRKLAATLREAWTPENAKLLRQKCDQASRQLSRTPFSNVVEQFGRISDAARRFELSRFDLTDAKFRLCRAVGEMDCALDIHRHSPPIKSETGPD